MKIDGSYYIMNILTFRGKTMPVSYILQTYITFYTDTKLSGLIKDARLQTKMK